MKENFRFILLLLFSVLTGGISLNEHETSPEALYREAVQKWQSNGRDWSSWLHFTEVLIDKFDKLEPGSKRLGLVGAFEEAILVIEKATVALGEGADPERDHALSRLYFGYGYVLSKLDPVECLNLAFDPHTLLIGAETVRSDNPSSNLCIENAENALRNAATLDATHTQAEKLLQFITGSNTIHKRKPKEFVAELFDSFADTFDEKLNSLGYRVPKMMGGTALELLSRSEKSAYRSALDAGCGTGLVGRYLRPFVQGPLVGVDASQKMLDIASLCTIHTGCGLDQSSNGKSIDVGKPLYEALLTMDLEDMNLENVYKRALAETEVPGFDLVVAADVLVYFGQLDNLLRIFSLISVPDARLIFSCELATQDEAPLGWRLLPSGRFAHTKQHAIEAAAKAGYELVLYEEIVPRMERGENVKGHLFAFVHRRGQGQGEAEL